MKSNKDKYKTVRIHPEDFRYLKLKWPDKLPRLSEFLMWVAGQKLGQQFAHSADSCCHKTPLIPEAFRDWTR